MSLRMGSTRHRPGTSFASHVCSVGEGFIFPNRCVYCLANLTKTAAPHLRIAISEEPKAQIAENPKGMGHSYDLWWADLSPVKGPKLGPFSRRSDALQAENYWLLGNWLNSARPV